jgi:hypothetical protein|nr:MAG TPA: tail collar fiber protein [Caudoviricetes sp.]
MADIKKYTDQIAQAVYGEEVRSSIINALNKVNDDNNSYQDIKDQIVEAKGEVDKQVANFDAKVKSAQDATSALNTAISNANTAKSQLTTATSSANTAKTNLDASVKTANTTKKAVDTATTNANKAKTDAETAKTNLDKSISSANTAKTNLETAIKNAQTAQTNLEGATDTANTARSNLTTTINSANTAKTELEKVITNAGTAQTNLSKKITEAETTLFNLNSANQLATENIEQLDAKNATAVQNINDLRDENFNAQEILVGVEDIKAYLGLNDEDIVGVQVDYKNKSFQRLAGAYNKAGGVDFDEFEMFGGRKRCNVSDDGTIVAWFGDDNFAEDGSMGQVMVYQPAFYYKVVPLVLEPQSDGVGYHMRKANYYVSSKPKTGFKRHPLFYDKNGDEIEFALLSAYEGSIYDVSAEAFLYADEQVMTVGEDLFCSISGAKPASGKTQLLTRPNIETMAQNRGSDWHGDLIKAESANQLLMIIEMGMMNLQTAIGQGVVSVADTPNTENNSIQTGGTSALGNATGKADGAEGKVSVTYRGVENPWANIWKFVYGVNIHGNGSQKGGIPYICNDFVFAESKNSGNYESAGFTVTNVNGYISAMGYGNEDLDWIFFASETLGNSSIPVGDYTYVTTDLNGYRIALLGGGWNNGASAGGFCWNLSNGVSGRYRNVGGRLVYVPTKQTATAYETNINSWKQKMVA